MKSAEPPFSALICSAIQFLQIRESRSNERPNCLFAEIEPKTCRAEQVRQGPRPAQRLSLAVLRDRLFPILLRIAPDLQGAGLRDSVLDVVERNGEQVQLPVPVVGQRFLVPGPVLTPAQTPLQVQPRLFAVGPRVAR